MHEQRQASRRHGAHEGLVGGAILIALGVVILTQHLFGFVGFGFPWQLFIIGPGILLFGLMVMGGRGAARLAIPASAVTMVGMILLFQGMFDHYESWAYTWALLPVAGSVGTMIAGMWSGNREMAESGKRAATGSFGLFVAFAAFFELLIFRHGSFVEWAWTAALILVGAFFVVRGIARLRARDRWQDDAPPPPVSTAGEGEVFPY